MLCAVLPVTMPNVGRSADSAILIMSPLQPGIFRPNGKSGILQLLTLMFTTETEPSTSLKKTLPYFIIPFMNTLLLPIPEPAGNLNTEVGPAAASVLPGDRDTDQPLAGERLERRAVERARGVGLPGDGKDVALHRGPYPAAQLGAIAHSPPKRGARFSRNAS